MDQDILRQQVLQRYQFTKVWQGRVFYDNEAEYFSSRGFISTLIRAFEEGESFLYKDFEKFPIETIIDYISRTHRFYISKSLLEIEQSITLLNDAYHHGHPLLELLNVFFLEYKSDLIAHIRMEDQQLLPYIIKVNKLLNNEVDAYSFFSDRSFFSIKDFLANHHDNDEVLMEVRNKIMTYDPPLVNRFVYNVLLNQLEFFAMDLKIHGLIEENVLIPAALEMEHQLNSYLLEKVKLN